MRNTIEHIQINIYIELPNFKIHAMFVSIILLCLAENYNPVYIYSIFSIIYSILLVYI